ncbi:VanZ family protein [bacterium]|nr:VanZ family protein [bacterium]
MHARGPGPLSRWLPVVAWASLVSFLSSDVFSGDHTGGFLLPLLRGLLGWAPSWAPDLAHAAIRKLAHVTEYAVLALLVARALDRPERTRDAVVAGALAFCAAHASLDEWHQTFVPSRVGCVADALLDTFGAAAGLALLALAGAKQGTLRTRRPATA